VVQVVRPSIWIFCTRIRVAVPETVKPRFELKLVIVPPKALPAAPTSARLL
jgi:hypothetical protein